MVERKLFKTKLCMLYQRGRCPRQYCNFAHGDVELRRSFNGRRDLRERLERMRSPVRKYSPERDVRGRRSAHGDSPHSFGKRNDRNQRKRQKLDGHSDYSGSLRMSDGTEDQNNERRHIDEQLREMHSEIRMLDKEKRRLTNYVQDKDEEAKDLNSKIQDLDNQLLNEKAECKRITAKMKKFIKAHNRVLRLKDELKRAHSQLEKLGEQLDLDATVLVNDDDSKLDSDDENGGKALSPLGDCQMNSSQRKRRSRVSLETRDGSKEVDPVSREKTEIGKDGLERISQLSKHPDKLNYNNSDRPNADGDSNNINTSAYEVMSLGANKPPDIALTDKHKVSEMGITLPPTAIAAHSIDEGVEVVEKDERFQGTGAPSTGIEKDVTSHLPFPPPPPPPIPRDVYKQDKGDDEKVDIDGLDEEMVEVDIV